MSVVFDPLLGKLRSGEGGGSGGGVSDVKVNGVSVVSGGVADITVMSYPLAECKNLGIVYGEQEAMLNYTDPDNVVFNSVTLADWKITVMVRKPGSYPDSYSDGTIVACTAANPAAITDLPSGVTAQLKNYYRDHQLVDSNLEAGVTYYYALFSQTKNGTWNVLVANQYPTYTSMTPEMLAIYTDAGVIENFLSLGDLLTLDHPEYPGCTMRVVGFDQMTPENEAVTHTLNLDMSTVLFTAPFDAGEDRYAITPDAAAVTGTQYYVLIGSTYTAITTEAGDTSVTVDDVVYPISEWYEQNPATSNSGSGKNICSQSNLVNWANSDGPSGSLQKKNIWDKISTTYSGKNGFMNKLPSSWKNAVIPIRRTNSLSNAYGGGTETWFGKFFPLSLYEVGINSTPVEGKAQLSYYSSAANRVKCLLSDGVTATAYWSASPYVSGADHENYVSTSGASTSIYANNAYGVSLACAIGKLPEA